MVGRSGVVRWSSRALSIAAALASVWLSPAAVSGQEVPAGLRCLSEAYPRSICEVTPTELVWCDGERMAYRHERSALSGVSLEDQMATPYPRNWTQASTPEAGSDPGRARHEPFFKKMYGASARDVAANIAKVRWLDGKWLRVTTVNGVNRKLEAVVAEVSKLPLALRERVTKSSGTFVWRRIKGTDRLSMHSFAIAIDVGVEHSDYWRWSKRKGALEYRNRIPIEVVEIFEKHGFIWGGKWYHFDTMHFEYRPELLIPGCAGLG